MTSPIKPKSPVSSRNDERLALQFRRTRSLERLSHIAVAILVMIVVVAVLYLFSDVVILLFAAIMLACQLRAIAMFISRFTRLPYAVCLAVTVSVIAATFGGFSYWRGLAVAAKFHEVASDVQTQFDRTWLQFGSIGWLQDIENRVETYIIAKGGNLAGEAASFVTSTIGNAGSVLLIVIVGIYLAAQPRVYMDGVVRLLPHDWRERGYELLAREAHTLRFWFVGQLVDMIFIGVLITVGLWLLGVPLFPTLGLIAALFNFVPYIGALAGSIPAIIIAFGISPHLAIYVAILFFVVQALEGNLISPLISRRTVDMPPVLTLLSQTVLGTLFGTFGLILATPLTAALLTFNKLMYVEEVLEDKVSEDAKDASA